MNINYYRSQVATKYSSMKAQRTPLSVALLFFVLLNVVVIFQGCATTKTLTVPGMITTPENRSFSLSSKDQKLLIKPGNMNIELMEHLHDFMFFAFPCSSLLQMWTDQGKIITEYPPEWKFRVFGTFIGKLTGNKLHIVGASQEMSSDIDVTWADHSEQLYAIHTTEPCWYSDLCWVSHTETTCDKDGKNCTEESIARWETCTKLGSQDVIITYEKYKRFYTLDFLNPQNNAELNGHFEGQTDSLQREVAREPTSACR